MIVDGTSRSALGDTVVLRAGRTAAISARFRYNAVCHCSVLIAMTPDWARDHSRGWQTIKAVPSPALEGTSPPAGFVITAPPKPGDYHLIFGLAPETAGEFILSQMNWKLGRPSWNDSNDLADLTATEMATARATGNLIRIWQWSPDYLEATGPGFHHIGTPTRRGVGAAVLSVRVVP